MTPVAASNYLVHGSFKPDIVLVDEAGRLREMSLMISMTWYDASYYLAYTEVFDPLIDEGWRIVPVPVKQVYKNVRKDPPGGPVDSPSTPALSTPRRMGLRPRSEAFSSASRG